MSLYFFDTSALAKRYIKESGSLWVTSLILPVSPDTTANTVVMSDLTTVEMFSLFARRQREGSLTSIEASQLQAVFMYHIENHYLVTPIDHIVLAQARTLVNKHPLRALDSLQLSSALVMRAHLNETITFLSADSRLLNAASAEGLLTDDPNKHS